jgi:hypothetical protein
MMLADKKNGGAPLLEPFEKWASGQPATMTSLVPIVKSNDSNKEMIPTIRFHKRLVEPLGNVRHAMTTGFRTELTI